LKKEIMCFGTVLGRGILIVLIHESGHSYYKTVKSFSYSSAK
jgi:hypothetical protein